MENRRRKESRGRGRREEGGRAKDGGRERKTEELGNERERKEKVMKG